jgi:uncharacterized membrane protein
MGWIFSGIFSIVMGASGQFVLRGTNSSEALVAAGVVMIIIGIAQLVWNSGNAKKNAGQSAALLEEIKNSEPLGEPCTVTLTRDSSFAGMVINYKIFLNGEPLGTLKNGTTLSAATTSKKNFIGCPKFPNLFVFDAQDGGNAVLKFKPIGSQHIELVSGGVVSQEGPGGVVSPDGAPGGIAPRKGAAFIPLDTPMKLLVIAVGAVVSFLLIRFLTFIGGPDLPPNPLEYFFSGWILAYPVMAIGALLFGPVVGGAIGLLSAALAGITGGGVSPWILLSMTMSGLYGFLLGTICEKNANPVLFVLSAPGLFIALRLANLIVFYVRDVRGLQIPLLGFLGYQLLPALGGALVIAVISLVTAVVYKNYSGAKAKDG